MGQSNVSQQSNESKQERIARLLREGLDHYGVGEVSEAILLWREVLLLDPDDEHARDYIKTADRRNDPRPLKSERTDGAVLALLNEARQLIAKDEFQAALDLIVSAGEADLSSLELEATAELVRSHLHLQYLGIVGDLSAIPVLREAPNDLTRFNLPSEAGFILSLVDGGTSIGQLMSLSGMDAFEALRLIGALLDTGIVGMEE